ncbi:MAG TPA: hypothetical protein VNL71_07170, partial [Chloroflexota bacterium]|nr:hypothetical protein [Chloroflexota bacterium]
LDFEREATDPGKLAGLRRRLQVTTINKQSAITTYLDEVYERVRKRRERAGEEGRPPPGWRTRARAAILRRLDESR